MSNWKRTDNYTRFTRDPDTVYHSGMCPVVHWFDPEIGRTRRRANLPDDQPETFIGNNRWADMEHIGSDQRPGRKPIQFNEAQWDHINALLRRYCFSRIASEIVEEMAIKRCAAQQLKEHLSEAKQLVQYLTSGHESAQISQFDADCWLHETVNLNDSVDSFLREVESSLAFSGEDREGRRPDPCLYEFVADLAPLFESVGGKISSSPSAGKQSRFVRLAYALLNEVPREYHKDYWAIECVRSQVKAYENFIHPKTRSA